MLATDRKQIASSRTRTRSRRHRARQEAAANQTNAMLSFNEQAHELESAATTAVQDNNVSLLNPTLDSPYHNETIKTSAKIADMKTIKRTNMATTHSGRHCHHNNSPRPASFSSPYLIRAASVTQQHHLTASSWCASHQIKSITHHHHKSHYRHRDRTPLLYATTAATAAMSLVTLLLVVVASTLPTGVLANGGGSEAVVPMPTTQALVGAKPGDNSQQQNVIVIKYANVTKATSEQGDDQPNKLNVYELYNEPLSVSVIQSKFSQSLESFDVSHNQLSTLSKDLFCPLSSEVRQLNISHNLLENFDCLGLISKDGQLCLIELRVLDMSYNLIKHLPDTGVATLHNLEVLNLSHNLIETLDEISLSSLFKLTQLDLSHNRIQQLPVRIFHKSTSIQVLKLHSNHLQNSVNSTFMSGLISLVELNLSYNAISHVSMLAFLDKPNLTRVDLSHNLLNGLHQDALRVTALTVMKSQQAPAQMQASYKPRLHHNGEYAGLSQVVNLRQPTRTSSQQAAIAQTTSVEFYLSSNPFVCDCQLDWMRKFQQAIKRSSVLTTGNNNNMNRFQADSYHDQTMSSSSSSYQSDQPASVINQQQQQASSSNSNADQTASTASNNISENVQASSSQQQSSQLSTNQLTSVSQQQQQQQQHYARIADLDLIKCSPLFRRNLKERQQHQHGHGGRHSHHNLAVQVHHANNHLHHGGQMQQHNSHSRSSSSSENSLSTSSASAIYMIDLLTADSSNFLCRYKSHCFALCHCCEFDACDCEMICPANCNCYYDSKWETNIIDCSSSNHTVVPDRIPMDVSGLYLDGNNIDSLKPSNLIARKSLKTLYLNASNLQYIANRTFNGLIELQTLYLNDNMLRTLHGYEFEPLAQLRALYLQSNRLDHIANHTFTYLRSLEVLDLSNNRLTSMNLDLFVFIGHHNIRLRQLSIAHNWWSCQCNSINSFRALLKQKFLVNGGVNTGVSIVDRNQLRCYYNTTTVGPLILDSGHSSSQQQQQQPLFGSFLSSNNNRQQQQQQQQPQQQQQLTEINQCSDMIEELQPNDMNDVNPPIIYPPPMPAFPEQAPNTQPPNDSPWPQPSVPSLMPHGPSNPYPPQQQPSDLSPYPQPPPPLGPYDPLNPSHVGGITREYEQREPSHHPSASAGASVPLTSFVVASVLFVCIFVVAISIFVFIRQQQRYHHHHHKKSSAASTTSVSSSASSTAISSAAAATAAQRHHHQLHHGGTSKFHQHEHHLHLPQPTHFGHTLQHQHQHNLIMGAHHQQANNSATQVMPQHQHHHHSASSHSNIYAALVPPTATTNGSSTIVTNIHQQQQQQQQQANNLYSNSSTTASHHSSSNSSQHNGQSSYPAASARHSAAVGASGQQGGNWHQQPIYGSQMHQHQLYGGGGGQANGLEGPYAINASVASYKTGTSLYNGPVLPFPAGSECHERSGVFGGDPSASSGDWISLPKVKQFVSKLVNKSLALGGYRSSSSRDELSNITSDKIYDAFLSYDKRDEQFVMQYLSAELEYGSPQYRVADRYRDLPLPSSAYIAEAITSVVGCSHRTIIVLTENYLTSDWCRYELQAALRETALDKSHKIIAVLLDPKCLQQMDSELRNMLFAATGVSGAAGANSAAAAASQIYAASQQQPQNQQLVQLADGSNSPSSALGSANSPAAAASDYFNQQQLVTTLTSQAGQSTQQVCTQTAGARLTFINYNERKFWPKIKQLMPVARPSTQTLTLTTKN